MIEIRMEDIEAHFDQVEALQAENERLERRAKALAKIAHESVAELAAAQAENERHESFIRAIRDCRDDPASAIAWNDITNGRAIIEAERLRSELAAARRVVQAATEQRDEALAVLSQLVRLKDGPRDEWYRDEKPRAWEAARAAVAGPGPTDDEQGDNR